EAVTHWWDVGLSVVCTDGLGDVVGTFVGVDEFVVSKGLTLGFEPVSGDQGMAEGGFIACCALALSNPDDPYPVNDASGGGGDIFNACQFFIEGFERLGLLGGVSGGKDTFASTSELLACSGAFFGFLRVHVSFFLCYGSYIIAYVVLTVTTIVHLLTSCL